MFTTSTLPREYFEFKSVWESVDVKDRSVDLLIDRVCLIEQRLPQKESQGSALTAKENKSVFLEKDKFFNKEKVKKKVSNVLSVMDHIMLVNVLRKIKENQSLKT